VRSPLWVSRRKTAGSFSREITVEGRSRAWVNGSPTTAAVLAQLGGLLVDLHGQHETQSLLRAETQRDLLDAFADAEVERVAVRDAHERLRSLLDQEAALHARQDEARRKADYLRHVVEEIARAAPKVGEDATLELEARRLSHADELGRLARELEQVLEAAGLARAGKLIGALERLDPAVGGWRELLDTAFTNVELAGAAREYAGLDADPPGWPTSNAAVMRCSVCSRNTARRFPTCWPRAMPRRVSSTCSTRPISTCGSLPCSAKPPPPSTGGPATRCRPSGPRAPSGWLER
jgi:DNA repair protein RecN (Recombination protein N)